MKIEAPRNIVGTNMPDGEAYKVTANHVLIDVLNNKLYTNIITAILREIGCNAYDSHVEAGKKDVPFKVKLPSHIDPTLVFEDFGVGMDHDDIIETYTVYGKSTKRDSNELVGARGLGSKTPFGYQDSFSIESVKNGVKRSYIATIESGVPHIRKLYEGLTTSSNGVKITIPIKDSDINNFVKSAEEIFKYFDTPPIVEGNGLYVQRSIEYFDIVPNLAKLSKNSALGNYLYLLQGNIKYNLSLSQIIHNLPYDSDLDTNAIKRLSLYLTIPIGEIDLSASREEVQYTKKTCIAIHDVLKKVVDVYYEKIADTINSFDSYWSLMEQCNRYNWHLPIHFDGLGFDIQHLINTDTTKDGKKVFSYHGRDMKRIIKVTLDDDLASDVKITYYKNNSAPYKVTKTPGTSNWNIPPLGEKIIWNDKKSRFMPQIKKCVIEQGGRGVVVRTQSEEAFKEILKQLDCKEFIKISDVEIEKPDGDVFKFKPKTTKSKLVSNIKDYVGSSIYTADKFYINNCKDYSDLEPSYYIPTSYNKPAENLPLKVTSVSIYKSFLSVIGIDAFFTQKRNSNALEKAGWKKLDTENFKSDVVKNKHLFIYLIEKSKMMSPYYRIEAIRKAVDFKYEEAKKNAINDVRFKEIDELDIKNMSIDQFITYMNDIGINDIKDIRGTVKDVMKDYPLALDTLNIMQHSNMSESTYLTDNVVKNIDDYVKLIDSSKEEKS